jgi:hypothetical protein
MPSQEKMEPALQQFRSRIAEAAVGKTPLRIRGSLRKSAGSSICLSKSMRFLPG